MSQFNDRQPIPKAVLLQARLNAQPSLFYWEMLKSDDAYSVFLQIHTVWKLTGIVLLNMHEGREHLSQEIYDGLYALGYDDKEVPFWAEIIHLKAINLIDLYSILEADWGNIGAFAEALFRFKVQSPAELLAILVQQKSTKSILHTLSTEPVAIRPREFHKHWEVSVAAIAEKTADLDFEQKFLEVACRSKSGSVHLLIRRYNESASRLSNTFRSHFHPRKKPAGGIWQDQKFTPSEKNKRLTQKDF